jgi:DNA processing protein
VAVVGTREVSEEGARRTRKLAAMLVQSQITVVSGLAMGVDTQAHSAALAAGGRTIAVIGTPMDRCNPQRNAPMQEEIYRQHLLISQFEWGSTVFPQNFPQRNRTMAAVRKHGAPSARGHVVKGHVARPARNPVVDLYMFCAQFNTPRTKQPLL